MDIKEAKKRLSKQEKISLGELIRRFNEEGIENFVVTRQEIIETVLNELELKDKVIDEMAKCLEILAPEANAKDTFCELPVRGEVEKIFKTKESIKEYFTNKVKLQSIKESAT